MFLISAKSTLSVELAFLELQQVNNSIQVWYQVWHQECSQNTTYRNIFHQSEYPEPNSGLLFCYLENLPFLRVKMRYLEEPCLLRSYD